jgi:phospholipid/cholesterol/gamma-HCH transport system substrate-binding protein
MEVRARYLLMGVFSLAVITGVFAFVYWLEAVGGLTARSNYKIRFDSPVAGLLQGSAVLFNGVRVGEVVALTLDGDKPEDVVVEIAVERRTPVRGDTRVGIDFQGLAGAPVVSLVGGSASLPLIAREDGAVPELAAEKDAGLGMTQVARQVLKRLDTVISENAEPLKSTISNINSFAAALARNSDKVDGIVAGLERFTGAARAQARVFDLSPATPDPLPAQCPTSRLLVLEPTALALIDAERVQITGAVGDQTDLAQIRWPDILSKVLQTRIVQSFENAGYSGAVPRTMEDVQTDNRLMTNVRAFEVEVDREAVARVEIAAKIVDPDGAVVASRIFRGAQQRGAQTVEAAMEALVAASRGVLGELVVWGCDALAAREKQSP